MVTATIFEAKTNLSRLMKKARSGETVIITSGRDKTPVAKLEAVAPPKKIQRLGFMEMRGFELGDAFWEPLPEDELRLWNGALATAVPPCFRAKGPSKPSLGRSPR